MNLPKKPIEELFAAMYHGKQNFADFIGADVASLYTTKTPRIGSKRRTLHVPSDKLRAYHEFLNLFVFEFLPVNTSIAFAYRKGSSAADAVRVHKDGRHFLVNDLADFFPSIDVSLVRSTLIVGATACPVEALESHLSRILQLVCIGDALPLGFATSPILSNAALFAFDTALQKACESRSLVYSRYSDDLIISGSDRDEVAGAGKIVEGLLHEHFGEKLRLNPFKSKSLHLGSKVRILGMVLLPNGKVTVDAKLRANIEVLLYFYLKDRAKFAEFAKKVTGEPDKAEARLSGWLNYINSVDQDYLDKLRMKYGSALVDRFVHRSFG
ncbi:reverse transcriptase domain-containing protein [Ramlibacter sp. AN1015]|uniref:reverse transcriptase domain-containing protein n=1 Tax=Ramlibacter sp. AN1015 TaxID=3133428 RepID=UPI0030BCF196